MYLDKWLILILICAIGMIGYTLGEDSGYMKGWQDRSKQNQDPDED